MQRSPIKPTVEQRLANAAEDGRLNFDQYVRVITSVLGFDGTSEFVEHDGWIEIEQEVSDAARKELLAHFAEMEEPNGNGFLSVEELIHGLNGTLDQARQETRECHASIRAAADVQNEGKLHSQAGQDIAGEVTGAVKVVLGMQTELADIRNRAVDKLTLVREMQVLRDEVDQAIAAAESMGAELGRLRNL